jgi:GH15 family glucan-1,4-alpha-glucosidase
MAKIDRREFILNSSGIVGVTSLLSDSSGMLMAGQSGHQNSHVSPLYNVDVQTAIGLGDELASIVDRFGQVRSRKAEVNMELGSPPRRASACGWSQSLEGGYLPIVHTNLRSPSADLSWVAFASAHQDLKCDYVGIKSAEGAYRITLLFPFTTSITVDQGIVTSGDELLATFPQPQRLAFTQAKYNCLTPETLTWSLGENTHLPADVDPAFGGGRTAAMGGHSLDYRFPVTNEQDYHVFLGLLPFDSELDKAIQRLTVNGQRQVADLSFSRLRTPILIHFVTAPMNGEIHVRCEPDPSTMDPYMRFQLNGIWVFDHRVETRDVMAGRASKDATFYVQCGREPIHDLASSVVLEYAPQRESSTTRWIRLPYDSHRTDAEILRNVSPESAMASVKERWDSLLAKGAEFSTGDAKLDNLYKSSVINIFLLREKCAGAASDGGDLYIVKPGATQYDNFWYRDGCYIITALGAAGHADESEKSLRLIWQSGLKGMFGYWGQQECGVWQAPATEWDGQGQSLWALVNHYEFTRDKEWLRRVYSSIRKGAFWIKNGTEQTQIKALFGERPIYYGLLPRGEGEGIHHGPGGYYYYHDFWAALGLRQAIVAAEALGEKDDVKWMRRTYEDFCSYLMGSVETAYERVANRQFIPATPYDANLRKWGALSALYPCRFLEPHNPMMTSTLAYMERESREDLYHFWPGYQVGQDLVWTYMTADWATCYLLRDELTSFYRFFNGYVSHAAPTNVWVEIIDIKSRMGVGDMPHGWAAAQYMLLHRDALVFENQKYLELCWGVQPSWLDGGSRIVVKRAPTKFGKLDLELKTSGQALLLEYHLEPEGGYPSPEEIRFHIPQLKEKIVSVQINGKVRTLSPGKSVMTLP